MKKSIVKISLAAACMLAVQQGYADGNRYDFERYYESEVSASEAYFNMKKGKAMLIDVRRLREYASGHPEYAYHVPYPHIIDSNDQDPVNFYNQVYSLVNGNTDMPIMLLCRTGARSVHGGNILANPDSVPGLEGSKPFTHVRNIWEGFVGQLKEPHHHPTEVDGVHVYLDLNNDGVINEDVADVYSHTKDANPDKDGWRNHMQLPWSTKISRSLAYLGDKRQYKPFIEKNGHHDHDHDHARGKNKHKDKDKD